MGHLHKVADARMPIFGGSGMIATLAFAIAAPFGTTASGLALVALVGLLIQLYSPLLRNGLLDFRLQQR